MRRQRESMAQLGTHARLSWLQLPHITSRRYGSKATKQKINIKKTRKKTNEQHAVSRQDMQIDTYIPLNI